MHVCFLLPAFEVYAPESGLALAIITHEVSSELRVRGVETTVISPSDGTPLYPGGRTIALPYDPANPRASFVSRLRRKVEHWDVPSYDSYVRCARAAVDGLDRPPDAIVLFNDLITGGELARRHDVPVYTWLQNEVTTNHRLGLRRLGRTQGLLAVSTYIAEQCERLYGPAVPKVSVVPNAVNTRTFAPPVAGLDSAPSPVKACFVGRIDPNKGPLLAANAVERARRRGVEISLDVAGPVIAWGQSDEVVAAYVDELEATLARTGGRWLGQVTRRDLPGFYQKHHLAFVPSVSAEPFGLVALEAMASGCAVIASNRGGLPEVCGDAALLVDPESEDQFDRAIDALVKHPPALVGARASARSHAEQRTWATTVDRLLDVVSAVA